MGFRVQREREISAPDNYRETELALNGVITEEVCIITCANYTCIMISSLALECFNTPSY